MEFLTVGNALLAALAVAGGFGWRWVDRLQKQQDLQAAAIAQEGKDRNAFEKKVLEDFAKKNEVKGSREEIMVELKGLSAKMDKLTEKLAEKKDRDDG